MGKFKTDMNLLRTRTAEACIKNFLELERVLSDLGPENFRRPPPLTAIAPLPPPAPPPGGGGSLSSCLVITQNTQTGEDTYILTPCLVVLDADFDIGSLSEVSIVL
jgi:hypothetical protein